MNSVSDPIAEGSADETVETSADPRSILHCRHVQLTAAITFSIVLLTILIFDLEVFQGHPQTRADIQLALPFLQAVGAAVIRRLTGSPKSLKARCAVVVLHLICGVSTYLLFSGSHRWAMIQGTALLLRAGTACGWLAVAVGTVVLMESIRRRSVRWSSWVLWVLRICFACAVVIVPLEITAAWIEQSRRQELPFPDDLKPSDSVHIATIGGSTMLGFPYAPHYGIGKVVVWQLRQMFPNHKFVLDNIALTGANLEQAIARLSIPETLPDIVVVYSGHNEFFHRLEELTVARKSSWGSVDTILRWSPLFRVLDGFISQYSINTYDEVDFRSQLCGMKICPDYFLEKRLRRYEMQLEQLFQWAASNGVSVVFCSPAACEADFAPNLSAPDAYTPSACRSIESLWNRIRDHQKREQWDDAGIICREALQLFPNFAEFHFQLGRSLQKLGQHEEAGRHFRQAMDNDQSPLRCPTSYRAVGLRAAEKYNLPVLDSARLILRHSETGYLDQTQFPDGVHPNLQTTYRLGRAVTDLIARHGLLKKLGTPTDPQRTSFPASAEDLQIDASVLSQAYRTTAGVLRHYATFRPFDQTRRITEAQIFQQWSEALSAGELLPGQGGTESLTESVPYFGTASPE